jgi:hypothetical protein
MCDRCDSLIQAIENHVNKICDTRGEALGIDACKECPNSDLCRAIADFITVE